MQVGENPAPSEGELEPLRDGELVVLTIGCSDAHDALRDVGLNPEEVASGDEAIRQIHRREVRALLLRGDGGPETNQLIRSSRREAPLTEVLVWAPGGSGEVVRGALQSGAKDVVLVKTPNVIASAVRRTIDRQQLLPRMQRFELARSRSSRFEGLVSRSSTMWELFETVVQIAPSQASVIVLGETGTGKELLARAIHKHSGRKGRFVAVNCGAIPENLIDSELFGHEKGAFTGAQSAKQGLFRHADGGTLFLDEVGNLPLTNQFSLLRALQEGTIRPIGGAAEIPVDARVIAATSTPLDQAVRQGLFREDLLYRLDVIRLVMPPLRERSEDVIHLFGYFRRKLAKQYRVSPPEVTDGFLEALLAYDWPGNVRELENFVERLVLTQQGKRLTRRHFKRLMQTYEGKRRGPRPAKGETPPLAERRRASEADRAGAPPRPRIDLRRSLAETVDLIEKRYLEAALGRHRGRVKETAETAGVSERTLLRKMKRHDLDKADFK